MSTFSTINLPLLPAILKQWEYLPGDINVLLERMDETIKITTAPTLEASIEYADKIPDEECLVVLHHCVLGMKECVERFQYAIAEAEEAGLGAVLKEVKELQGNSELVMSGFEVMGLEDAMEEEDGGKLKDEVVKVAQAMREVKRWTDVVEEALGRKV
ncbi:hypothetical protein CB0940_01864 [Cercospora beticola]|uniref:Uncharacterized protein n=1 Tax=Cercospora beticola TaxID=122368 RepID=A0A2G5I909_CERBT|nr:hypothetical protein CB0940_01864 [Cercospora beticola]PIB01269.1 hypothetical protein CB0940_01864 [Cercospora beticola]WPA97319.1 hypothetical protein RHO25_001928 [Cercospora beticola]